MKIAKSKLFLILFLCFGQLNESVSKVDPPNYDFSLDQFKAFSPGEVFPPKVDEKTLKSKKLINKSESIDTYRFYIAHIRYKFPIFIQVDKKSNKILDFFATLPRYFLHDIFHQSLINRIGKQDQFIKVESNSLYIWNNKNNLKYIYSGTCTITCFPVFYTSFPTQKPNGVENFLPLMEKMNNVKPAE